MFQAVQQPHKYRKMSITELFGSLGQAKDGINPRNPVRLDLSIGLTRHYRSRLPRAPVSRKAGALEQDKAPHVDTLWPFLFGYGD